MAEANDQVATHVLRPQRLKALKVVPQPRQVDAVGQIPAEHQAGVEGEPLCVVGLVALWVDGHRTRGKRYGRGDLVLAALAPSAEGVVQGQRRQFLRRGIAPLSR